MALGTETADTAAVTNSYRRHHAMSTWYFMGEVYRGGSQNCP